MEKRLPLAIVLSLLVLVGWQMLFGPPPQEPDAAQVPGAAQVDGGAGSRATGVANETGGDAGSGRGADADPSDASGAVVEGAPPPSLAATKEETVRFEVGERGRTGHYLATFSNRGGALTELRLGEYFTRVGLSDEEKEDTENWLALVESVATLDGATGSLLLETSPSSEELVPTRGGLSRALWDMQVLRDADGRENGVEFRYGPGTGVVFVKRFTFEPGTWRMRMQIGIENVSSEGAVTRSFHIVPAGVVPPEFGDSFYPEPRAIAVGSEDDTAVSASAPGLEEPGVLDAAGRILCAGVHNKYFAFLMRDDGVPTLGKPRYQPVNELADDGEARPLIVADVPIKLALPDPGETKTWDYVIYAGPKDQEDFVGDFEAHQLVLDSDMESMCGLSFTTIGRGLLAVLRWIHTLTGNWGVAVILLTLCVRLVLFPLNRRSQTAMARYQTKMKRVQPRLEEIKKKYENDAQKQREAQAKIMQEEGAFPPLGGCMPMFLQMPIFLGLFTMLRTSFDLRHQPFYGWIQDLAAPDRLLRIDLPLPILGTVEYLNLLPILMVVMWILQQRGMPQPTDEQAQRMQKMMLFMPVVFGFMLYNYAAGLSLYMLTTSTLGIFEQQVIKKVWPIDDTEVAKKQKSGCGPFAGFMEKVAEKQKEQMRLAEAQKAQRARQQKGKKKKR